MGFPLFEALESRSLFSVVSPAEVRPEPDPYEQAVRQHTLTPEQLREYDVVSMDWRGQQIYARTGEWIVGFAHPPATVDRYGDVVDPNVEWAGPATPPAPELVAKLEGLGLGLEFKQYVGVTHTVLIHVPTHVDPSTLTAALSTLPGYEYVEPNSLLTMFPAGSGPGTGVESQRQEQQQQQQQQNPPAGGNVTAVVRRGVLVIRGDAAANALTVSADGAGVRLTAAAGTTLNGRSDPLTFAAPRGVRAVLGGGDDRLTVDRVAVGGNVRVDTGRGADLVRFASASVGGDLRVSGKAGAKTVEVISTTVSGRTDVSTGGQADVVTLNGSTFAKRATVSTGRGDDRIVRDTSTVFGGGSRLRDGQGDDHHEVAGVLPPTPDPLA